MSVIKDSVAWRS